MRHPGIITLASLVVVATAASAAEWQVQPVLPAHEQATSSACDDLSTICATSKAVANAQCVPIDLVTVQCSGNAVVGGSGSSPPGLPGTVDWSGSAACSGTCGEPSSGSAVGVSAWPGFGVNGGGSEQTILLGPVTQTLLQGCISYTVTATADAHASTLVSIPGILDLPLTEANAPQTQDSATATICGPLP